MPPNSGAKTNAYPGTEIDHLELVTHTGKGRQKAEESPPICSKGIASYVNFIAD